MTNHAGAIIAQIEPRRSTPNRTSDIEEQLGSNPITFHVYPGRDNTYDMYLDDGVSRDSAPNNAYLSALSVNDANHPDRVRLNQAFGDQEAKGRFRHVRVSQVTIKTPTGQIERTVTVRTVYGSRTGDAGTTYTPDEVKRDIGDTYTAVFWHAPGANLTNVDSKVLGGDNGSSRLDSDKCATFVTVPVEAQNEDTGVIIVVSYSS